MRSREQEAVEEQEKSKGKRKTFEGVPAAG
jgi:hypothetical protein